MTTDDDGCWLEGDEDGGCGTPHLPWPAASHGFIVLVPIAGDFSGPLRVADALCVPNLGWEPDPDYLLGMAL